MIHIIDTGHPWVAEFERVCKERGVRYEKNTEIEPTIAGPIFYPVRQYPTALCRDQQNAALSVNRPGKTWIQDLQQIECYEDKKLQMLTFGKWMPGSWTFDDLGSAQHFAEVANYPLVSKAREGSSSHNVRILKSKEEALAEIANVFSAQGLKLNTQPHWQKGYWLVQDFVPHDITYRVTIVGSKIHIYKRFCYPDKAVAAPAKVVPTQPVDYDTPAMLDLIQWSRTMFHDIGTKFCAADVLRDEARKMWVLLETSLAWARGDDAAANSMFYDSKWTLNTQWELLLDEIEAGVFGRHETLETAQRETLVPAGNSLTVVCWLWDNSKDAKDAPAYAAPGRDWRALRDQRRGLGKRPPPSMAADQTRKYTAEHVNALQRQFEKYLTIPHRFVCIADSPEGLSDKVEFLKTPAAARALAKLPSPEGARFPSCYRRLWTWSDEAQVLGEHVLLVDIDTLLMQNIDHLIDLNADFIGWQPKAGWGSKHRVMGALYLLRTGAFRQVWAAFNGAPAIKKAAAAGYRGSDQAWIGYMLGPDAPVWPKNAGIYSIRDLEKSDDPPPKDACLIQFNGPRNPWNFTAKERPTWVAGAWREATAPATVADA